MPENGLESGVRRLRVTLAYDGAGFHGWQVQPGLATIQGTLEAALAEIEGQPVHVTGSGRTDAGVHARGQVASFDLRNPIPVVNLRRALNRLLPPSIRVLEAVKAAPSFHARRDARSKTYEYIIVRSEICSPFERRYVHHHPYPLDVAAMQGLARQFEGTHDFRAFAAADDRYDDAFDMRRTIFVSRLEVAGDRLIYRVRGSGFLKHMVRNLVGTLLEAGKGNLPANVWPAQCGPTAPASGLFLDSVDYGDAENPLCGG